MKQIPIPGFERPPVHRCSVCGRRLRDPKSISAGVGPACGRNRGRRILTSLRSTAATKTASELDALMSEAAAEIERLTKLAGKK